MSITNSTELQPYSAELTLLCGIISFGSVYFMPKVLQSPSVIEVSKWANTIYQHPNSQKYAQKLSVIATAKQAAGVACGLLSLGAVGAVFVYRTRFACVLSSAVVAGLGYIGHKLFPEGTVLAAATEWVLSRARIQASAIRAQANRSVAAPLQPLNLVPTESALLIRRGRNGLLINASRLPKG